MILIAILIAAVAGWGIHLHRVRLADDRSLFYSYEEEIPYRRFLKSVAIGMAEEAEKKATEKGADRSRWLKEAAAYRAEAAAHARTQEKYRRLAELKKSISEGGW